MNLSKDTFLREFFSYYPISKKNRELEFLILKSGIQYLTIPELHNSFIGIEIEAESIRNRPKYLENLMGWIPTEDNSLRNSGTEFVSIPHKVKNTRFLLENLFSLLEKYETPCFSERTSIHIHLNVRNFTISQLVHFIITYMAVERCLFSFLETMGPSRKKNIFCNPLTEAKHYLRIAPIIKDYFTENYSSLLSKMQDSWKKYSALNIIPLFDKGTIEFRHLFGTSDKELILTWISLILKIKKYILRYSVESTLSEINSLNTNSMYGYFINKVFEEKTTLVLNKNSLYTKDMEECISDIKQCFELFETEKYESFESLEEFKALEIAKRLNFSGLIVLSNKAANLFFEAKKLEKEIKAIHNLYDNKEKSDSPELEKLKKSILFVEEKLKFFKGEFEYNNIVVPKLTLNL